MALLRGINVGRAKRVSMGDLRAVVGSLGCRDCRTLLNSGNLVFTGPGAPGKIGAGLEHAISTRLGVESRVTVLDDGELVGVVEENSLAKAADNPSLLLVAFVADVADIAKLKAVEKERWAPEALAIGKRAAYLWCPGGIGKSPLVEAVKRVLGERVTMRNWATVQKLRALL